MVLYPPHLHFVHEVLRNKRTYRGDRCLKVILTGETQLMEGLVNNTQLSMMENIYLNTNYCLKILILHLYQFQLQLTIIY